MQQCITETYNSGIDKFVIPIDSQKLDVILNEVQPLHSFSSVQL